MEQEKDKASQQLLCVLPSGGLAVCVKTGTDGKVTAYNSREFPYELMHYQIQSLNRYYVCPHLIWRDRDGQVFIRCLAPSVRCQYTESMIQSLRKSIAETLGEGVVYSKLKVYDYMGHETTDFSLMNTAGRAKEYPMPVFIYAITLPVFSFETLRLIVPFRMVKRRTGKGTEAVSFELSKEDSPEYTVTRFNNMCFEGFSLIRAWAMLHVRDMLGGDLPLRHVLDWNVQLVFVDEMGVIVIDQENEMTAAPRCYSTAGVIVKHKRWRAPLPP